MPAARTSANIYLLVAAATVLSYALNLLGISGFVREAALIFEGQPLYFLFAIAVLMLILGTFLDIGAAILIQEEAVGLVPWFRDICTETYPLDMVDGVWGVPEAPGLGIEINEAAAARYPFKQEEIPALEAILSDGRIANW